MYPTANVTLVFIPSFRRFSKQHTLLLPLEPSEMKSHPISPNFFSNRNSDDFQSSGYSYNYHYYICGEKSTAGHLPPPSKKPASCWVNPILTL